jgi:hypothetical protein
MITAGQALIDSFQATTDQSFFGSLAISEQQNSVFIVV